MNYLFNESNMKWTLKLSNLWKLKSEMDDYLEEYLKISASQFAFINLSLLARNEDKEEIVKLIEEVVYILINSQFKEKFILNIMDLDEEVQTTMKNLIERVMPCDKESRNSLDFDLVGEIVIERSHYTKILGNNRNLETHLQEMHKKAQELEETVEKLLNDKEELRNKNFDLKSEIEYIERCPATEVIESAYEQRIEELRHMIQDSKTTHSVIESQYEAEIAKLKDDLDVAYCQVQHSAELELKCKQYRSKLQLFPEFKESFRSLQEENDLLKENTKMLEKERGTVLKLKEQHIRLEQENTKLREKGENSLYEFRLKEKENKRLFKKIEHLGETNRKQQEINEELRTDLLAFQNNESFVSTSLIVDSPLQISGSPYEALFPPLLLPIPPLRLSSSHQETPDNETLGLEQTIERKKETIEALKHKIHLNTMELRKSKDDNSQQITLLESENRKLIDEVIRLEDVKNEYNSGKIKFKQLKSENLQLTDQKNQLSIESSEYAREAETLQTHLNSERESHELARKELMKISYELTQLKTNEELHLTMIELLKSEKDSYVKAFETNSFSETPSKSEAKIPRLKVKIRALKSQLSNCKSSIAEIELSNSEAISTVKAECKEQLRKLDNENSKNLEKIRQETEDSIRKIHTLNNQALGEDFHSLRRQSTLNPSYNCSELAIISLNRKLSENEKRVTKLSATNRELKKAWENSMKILSTVLKELGLETSKLESFTGRKLTSTALY